MKYKVLIVDDEPMARRGIRVRLKAYSEFTILEDCEDGSTALEAIRDQAPDLVFLDIQMRGMDGFEMLKRLPKSRNPIIIFLTAYDQYALNEQAAAFAKYDPDRITAELVATGADTIVVYAANQFSIAYYPSKVWPQHPNLKGRDYVGDLFSRR